MTFSNVLLYSAVIPSYDTDAKDEDDRQIINADDPKNQDKISRILFN